MPKQANKPREDAAEEKPARKRRAKAEPVESTPEAKAEPAPRKRAPRKAAADAPAKLEVPKSEWAPKPDHPHPVGRALAVAIKAFKGDKGALAAYIGIKRPNLSRTLRECREIEQGSATGNPTWPPVHSLKLSKVSGVPLHEIAPDFYEPHMKPKGRFKPTFVDGKVQLGA